MSKKFLDEEGLAQLRDWVKKTIPELSPQSNAGIDGFSVNEDGELLLKLTNGKEIKCLKVGNGLQFEENNTLSVKTADEIEADNTLPVSSALVHTQIGNINTLLSTI